MYRMKVWRLGVVAVTAGLLTSVVTRADSEVDQLKKENAELRKRLEQIEGALSEIKSRLPAKTPEVVTTPTELTTDDVAQLKKLATMKDKPVHSGLDLKLYGYVKLDAAYDDSRVSVGNFARWVEPECVLKDDSHFNMTANQTRLGVDITGPESPTFKTSGKVELDFYGSGTAENKPEPMLRHAYLNLDWPTHHFGVLAGQTSDIISPLYINTVNYTVGWWQGNIGYRRPQVRLTKAVPLDDGWDLKLEGGITRTITGRKYVFKESTDPDSGADAGFPTVAGRVSLSMPIGEKRQATFGVSGHYGAEHQHTTNLLSRVEFDSWSLNVDARVPVAPWLVLQAEGFVGQNLDAYLGGIGQGIDQMLQNEIHSMGGWVAATITPARAWQFNLGAGMDDPDNSDLTPGALVTNDPRTRNSFVFGNCFYSFSANLQLGLEISYMHTTYKAHASGDAIREQVALIYKF